MSVKAKYIKDLPLKNELDGSESLLVQDSNGTKQAPLGTIVDEIKQNSQEKIREIESELAQTNAQLSQDKTELQSQINNLVLESGGDSNLEVIQARQGYPVLNERLKNLENAECLNINKRILNLATIIQNKTYKIDSGSWKVMDDDSHYMIAFKISELFNNKILSVTVKNIPLDSNGYQFIAYCDDLDTFANLSPTRYDKNTVISTKSRNYVLFAVLKTDSPDIIVSHYGDKLNYLENNYTKNLFKRGENLYDKDYKGVLSYSPTSVDVNLDKLSSNLFKLEPQQSIYFNKPLFSGQRDLVFIDTNFNYIERTNLSLASDGTISYKNTTSDILYLYISCVSRYWLGDDFMASYDELTIEELDNMDKSYWKLNITENTQRDYWYKNKVISAMGTSLTATGSGGLYLDYVSSALGFSKVVNCGIGGSRVSGGNSSGSSFWTDTRVNALDLESNVITIEGGANDAGKGLTLLDSDINLENTNTDTLCGAFNVLLSKIFYKFLKVEGYYSNIDYSGISQVASVKDDFTIVIINSPQTFGSKITWEDERKFVDYMRKIASMWGIPYCDVFSNMQMNYITYKTDNDGYDNVHFINFHKKMAEVVIGTLKNIEPI